MATVITNLVSAIPYIGGDLVISLWGGLNEPFNCEIELKILFIAGISSIFEIGYHNNLFMVKMPITRRQSAGITYNVVPQRLNTENLIYAWLVGFIESDGYFIITLSKNGKYLKYEFGIKLHIRDIQLLYKIKTLLGVGTIKFIDTKEGINSKTVIFSIKNKSHLINIILPIFDKYSLLTMKQYDYLRFKEILLKNRELIYYKDLPNYIRPNIALYSIKDIINKYYFSSWLIGFIEAKGCFSCYKSIKTNNGVNSISQLNVANFYISQSYDKIIIMAIIEYLSLTSNVNINLNNYIVKVSGVRSIENVIKFIHLAPVKLLGYKKLQYLLWIKNIRKIDTYTKKFKIPTNY